MNALILFLFLLISYVTACDRCVHQGKASYFSSDWPLSFGTCEYGSLALKFNGGLVVAGFPSLYDDGAGCGACFQMRCNNSALCSTSGTKVIMTDHNNNSAIDFVLSSSAFKAMAKPGMDQDLLKLRIANIEYKRIPCDYGGTDMALQVEKLSIYTRFIRYLAVKILYQGGQTEVRGVEVSQIGTPDWIYMTRNRNNGAVWETSKGPDGPLQFRFTVISGNDAKYIWAQNVLPENWISGEIYNTHVQITDIAQEDCSPCDTSQWK